MKFFALLFSGFSFLSSAQIINCYANVTAISGNSISLNNVDEANHTFENGDYVILMQMQDNCIGSNTTNVVTFGNLGSIQSAGLYEVFIISSHNESAGTPTSIVLNTSPLNTYNINANSSVQLVSFRLFGSPNYTTTSNVSAKNWNGTTGGILALQVTGTLTLAHTISANGSGFRGGAVSANYYSGGSGCTTSEYIRTSNHTRAGQKGEGIYKTSNNDFLYARGTLLNGGGGGSERINCGGGGGGNFTSGGEGGFGWSCAGPGGGGLGGLSLAAQISSSRIFMGGGGGGGQQNNSASTPGGNGGGIVFLKANQIRTNGACAGLRISANGNGVTGLTNDGQGGGGAGGSIVIQTSSWNISAACVLTVSANGGNGGSVNTSAHAGGGGGGQGVVFYSSAQPTVNVTTQTNNGAAGCNDNSNPCTNLAGAPSGTNNSGIVSNTTTPLPNELLYFKWNIKSESKVEVYWKILSESRNTIYNLFASEYGIQWTLISSQVCQQNSSTPKTYLFMDTKFDGLKYYRLQLTESNAGLKVFAYYSNTIRRAEFRRNKN